MGDEQRESASICARETVNSVAVEVSSGDLLVEGSRCTIDFVERSHKSQVTASGEPVYSLERNLHHGKRPYERLILLHTENASIKLQQQLRPCNGKLLASVPCAVPSTKPHLYGVIDIRRLAINSNFFFLQSGYAMFVERRSNAIIT